MVTIMNMLLITFYTVILTFKCMTILAICLTFSSAILFESFTGVYFCRRFIAGGYNITCPLKRFTLGLKLFPVINSTQSVALTAVPATRSKSSHATWIMTMLAFSFSCVLCGQSLTTQDVLFSSYVLKMRGVNALANSAQMIALVFCKILISLSFHAATIVQLVAEHVSLQMYFTVVIPAVTLFVYVSGPNPTGAKFRTVFGNWAVFINTLPEVLLMILQRCMIICRHSLRFLQARLLRGCYTLSASNNPAPSFLPQFKLNCTSGFLDGVYARVGSVVPTFVLKGSY